MGKRKRKDGEMKGENERILRLKGEKEKGKKRED